MKYRLKIKGVEFPDTLISKGSYSIKREKRIKATWKDGARREQYAYHKRDKVSIEFHFRDITDLERDCYYDALNA